MSIKRYRTIIRYTRNNKRNFKQIIENEYFITKCNKLIFDP